MNAWRTHLTNETGRLRRNSASRSCTRPAMRAAAQSSMDASLNRPAVLSNHAITMAPVTVTMAPVTVTMAPVTVTMARCAGKMALWLLQLSLPASHPALQQSMDNARKKGLRKAKLYLRPYGQSSQWGGASR